MLLLNEYGRPPFLFQNVGYHEISNQEAKFDKSLSAVPISGHFSGMTFTINAEQPKVHSC